ncbi:hypothetical protein Tco_0768227 [Tanacetum coccineum]
MRTRSQSREQHPPPPEEPPVVIEPLRIEYPFQEDPPVEPMADTRTMAQLLQAPTEGYEDAILIPEIVANNFELRHGLINLVQNKQFFGHDKEDPHAHIRYFNKITSTMRVPNVPIATIKLMLFPFFLSREQARIWLEKETPSIYSNLGRILVSKIHQSVLLPPSKTNCINFVTFYNALNINDQDSLNSAEVDTFWTKMPQRMFKINREHVQGFCSEHCSLTRRTKASAPATAPVKSKLRSGTLPGNTVTNPREDLKGITTRSGVAYQGPPIPTSSVVKPIPEVTKDQVHPSCSQSTAPSQLGMDDCLALADLGD